MKLLVCSVDSFCQVKMVKKAFDAQRQLIVLASKSQKPSTVSPAALQKCVLLSR